MFFNKKKEDKKQDMSELPELPKLPELPNRDEEIRDSQIPPSRFTPSDDLERIPNAPKNRYSKEIPDNFQGHDFGTKDFQPETSSGKKQVRVREAPEVKTDFKEEFNQFKQRVKEEENVFVRLDKFETALKEFDEVKEQLKEMESLLSKIKEVKEKETAELEGWDKEIQGIKSSLEDIDKKIFNKV